MAKISEHLNYTHHKIHSYDKNRKMIFNFGNKKGENNNNSFPQLTRPQNSLLMSIVDTPEKGLIQC